METVKVAFVGAGGIAQTHLRALSEIGGVQVVAVADLSDPTAKVTAERWGIRSVYGDYREMIDREDADAVVVCTPTAVHAPPAIAALEAGKHVLVEKPMEARLDAAAQMVRAAKRAGKILMCGLKLRFAPAVQVAKSVVESGQLGKLYYAEATADRRRATPGGSFVRKDLAGFGATADLGIYALDTALHIMGHPKPVSVSACTTDVISKTAKPVVGQWFANVGDMQVEEFAAAWVRFDNGACLVVRTSWAVHMDTLGGTYFLGTTGGLRIGAGEVRAPGDGLTIYRDEFGAMTDAKAHSIGAVDMMDLFRRENRAFRDAVIAGSESPIDPMGVLYAQTIIQGIVDSSEQRREVQVSVPQVE